LILSFELSTAERFIKPQKGDPLHVRERGALRWAAGEPKTGAPILIDTTVYLDALQGKTPGVVDDLLRFRKVFHSSVCLSELTHSFGRLLPTDPRTKVVLQALADTINDIPPQRLFEPDVDAWGKSGMLAGKIMRLAGIQPGRGAERKLQNDSLIYLQACSVGAAVLTRNHRDFDLLNQLVTTGAVIFY
jgi:predicted nucleic acid-binding protein